MTPPSWTLPNTIPRPKQAQIRLLYPFSYAVHGVKDAANALLELESQRLSSDNKKLKLWQRGQAGELYRQEVLDPVHKFLLGQGAGCCAYLQLNQDDANKWFRRELTVHPHGRPQFPIRLVADRSVELFLSPYGCGVLSIALELAPDYLEATPDIDLAEIKSFVYCLAQLRPATSPTLRVPHPTDRKDIPADRRMDIADPPLPDAPLKARLGESGGTFTLGELKDFVLSPLRAHAFQEHQQQFAAYTLVRLDHGPACDDDAVAEGCRMLVAGLAQIEEAIHPGAPDETPLAMELLNRRHLAGVSSLGAAHLRIDQEDDVEFNKQWMAIVRDKYFITYLLALLQQLTLRRLTAAAAQEMRTAIEARNKCSEEAEENRANGSCREASDGMCANAEPQDQLASYCGRQFRQVMRNVHEFSVNGMFPEASHRFALNRSYQLAQQGLRVPEHYREVATRVASIEAACRTEERAAMMKEQTIMTKEQAVMTKELVEIQNKVEWVELFIVSFYSLELGNVLIHIFNLRPQYTQVALPLLVVSTTLIMGLWISPGWLNSWLNLKSALGRAVGFLLIIASVVLYTRLGIQQRDQPVREKDAKAEGAAPGNTQHAVEPLLGQPPTHPPATAAAEQSAADQPGATAARADGKFAPLFNGRDLTGWHGDPELWKVVDGVVVGSTDDKQITKNSFLISDKSYKNFVLKVKFRLRNHNSGIQFRSKEGENFVVTGYQADMADKRYTGILHEEGGKLIVADVKQEEVLAHYKPGEWAEYVITANGPHIKQELNGYTTIDYTEPETERKAAEGIIALQLHTGPKMQVEFKDIEILELP